MRRPYKRIHCKRGQRSCVNVKLLTSSHTLHWVNGWVGVQNNPSPLLSHDRNSANGTESPIISI